MTRFARTEVINSIYERGLVPSFTAEDPNEARKIVKACADGGARVILCRIQNSTDVQFFGSLVEELHEQERDVILGAGPVADTQTAGELLNASAGFIIGATFDSEIARRCHRRKVN